MSQHENAIEFTREVLNGLSLDVRDLEITAIAHYDDVLERGLIKYSLGVQGEEKFGTTFNYERLDRSRFMNEFEDFLDEINFEYRDARLTHLIRM